MNKNYISEDDDLRKLAGDFLAKYNLHPYEYGKWYKKAYNVVNRIIALHKTDNNEWRRISLLWEKKNSEQFKEDIFKFLKELTIAGIIDKIGELANKYELPVGIVQKIISLIIKYIFCYYIAFENIHSGDIANTFLWIANKSIRNQLPIPIDSRILYSLHKMGTTDLPITVYGKYAKMGDTPWTRIGLDDYRKIQDTVRKLGTEIEMSPIEFEMKKLWK